MSRSHALRRRLVDGLERNGTLRSPAIRAAFLAIARETFVPELVAEHGLDWVYADEALVTRKRDGLPTSSSSQPSIMALMLEALDVRPGARVLEVGLGTGYNAAILRTLVGPAGSVTSVDIDPAVVAAADRALAAAGVEVRSVTGDGSDGAADWAPYDRIIVTASNDHLPYAWWEQLAADGILVVPLRCGAMQVVGVFARTATGFTSIGLIPGGFMPMRSAPDAPTSPGVTISVEEDTGDGVASSLSVSGPGLSRLDSEARSLLTGRLLGPYRPAYVGGDLTRPVLWHALMATDVDAQISVHSTATGARFGLVGPDGDAALVHTSRDGDTLRLDEIELYGVADGLGRSIASAVARWRAAGRPDFDRLSVAFDYDPRTPIPEWALRTTYAYGQRRAMGWRAE